MSIVFSGHARAQLKVRKISEKQVREVIGKPDERVKSFRSRVLKKKRFNDKILEVVTVTEGSRITVITAYYLEENNEN